MRWLLETDIFNENLDKIKIELEKRNIEYDEVYMVPFSGSLYKKDKETLFEESNLKDYFLYGSLNIAKNLFGSVRRFCNLPQFLCSHYYPYFREYLFNYNFLYMPYGSLKSQKLLINYTLGHGQVGKRTCFIRPDRGDKPFNGQLIFEERWEKQVDEIDKYGEVQNSTMCLLAEPVNIINEWRFVVGSSKRDISEIQQQKVITCSHYMANEIPIEATEGCPAAVMDFVERVLTSIGNKYSPDPYWVLDVGQNKNGDYGVIETNSLSCSGWYACDVGKIIDAVSNFYE